MVVLKPRLPDVADFCALKYEVDDTHHCCVITLNRQNQANAIDSRLFLEILAALEHASADDNVWSIIWTGAGSVFCAGADFSGKDPGAYTEKDPRSAWTPIYRRGFNATVSDKSWVSALGEAFYSVDKPMIAALNGAAAGAGFSIALCCDIRIGCSKTKFVPAFTNVNLPPEAGLSFLLSRTVGLGRAMDIVLTGRVILAEEAMQIGLLSRVVDTREELLPSAKELAHILAGFPQPALHVTKAAVRKGLESTFVEALSLEVGIARKSATNPYSETMKIDTGASAKIAEIARKNKKVPSKL